MEQRLRGSMLRSKLNFVDLAGSERWNEQVEMSEVRVSEMTSINQSLSTLITVVASLTEQGRSHIPYRYLLSTAYCSMCAYCLLFLLCLLFLVCTRRLSLPVHIITSRIKQLET